MIFKVFGWKKLPTRKEWDTTSLIPNVDVLINKVFWVIGITNYGLKHYITIFIDEVLLRSGRDSLSLMIPVVPRVGQNLWVISNRSQKNIVDEIFLPWSSRQQAVHLDKSDLHHACFPGNLRAAFFSEHFRITVLTIWPEQFSHAFTGLQYTAPFLQYLFFISPFLANLCKVTLDIPET